MIRVGIRAHDIGKMDALSLANKVRDFGFDGVQLVLKKALTEYNDFSEIKSAFYDLDILMLGAYFNPIHPNQEEVFKGVNNFKDHLKIASVLDAEYVGSETGSLMGSPWGYVKDNHSDESLKKVIEVFKDLTDYAEKCRVKIAIEGAYAHVAYSPKRIREVLDAIKSNNLKVTIDLFNYLYIGNYQERNEIFEQCLDLLKDEIVIYHLKDFVVKDNLLVQVGLGKGLMNFPSMIQRIKEVTPNACLIFEGVTKNDISDSFTYIKKILEGEDI